MAANNNYFDQKAHIFRAFKRMNRTCLKSMRYDIKREIILIATILTISRFPTKSTNKKFSEIIKLNDKC